jgi:hypothetical protein
MSLKTAPNAAFTLCYVAAILSVSACAVPRIDHAEKIAQAAKLTRQDIHAAPFILASWQRLADKDGPIHVYIEGDGLAWISRSTPSHDPTPKNPVALSLAAADPAANIVYIARPCHYTTAAVSGTRCHRDYWTNKRYAAEVIESYQTFLNQLKQRYSGGFHLIGYSGGANIAGLLAEKRTDILSLRSVAGNLDNDFFTDFHKVSAMPLSLNMADHASRLATLPQYHFIAQDDDFVPPEVLESYTRKLGHSACIQATVVPGTEHQEGWTERWPALLKMTPSCKNSP